LAIERLKFRCYRCNQLLGATPNKAGSVVTCPKCSAELLIPVPELPAEEGAEVQAPEPSPAPSPAPAQAQARVRPEPRAAAAQALAAAASERSATATAVKPPLRPAQAPAYPDDLAAVLPPDLIDLRPEDLRVEAEFFESLTRQSPTPEVREPAPWPPTPAFAPTFEAEPYVSPVPAASFIETASSHVPAPARESQSFLIETVDLAPPKPVESPPPVPSQSPLRPEPASLGTAIAIEHPAILPASEPRRITEVVLPASAVLAFSLFALLGIALSFVAGLLLGHFIWTAH
jgi:hypothetical protein